jgi:hypothetical protein
MLRAIAGAAVCGFTFHAEGSTFNVSWIGGATGNYSTAANWSGGAVPDDLIPTMTSFYNVTINRAAGVNVTGNNLQTEVLNLTIGPSAANQLTLNDNAVFGVNGTAANGPATVNNGGTIQLGTTSASVSQFNFLGSTTNITGGGTIVMLGDSELFGSGTVTSDNLIVGLGSFGVNNFAFINNGTVTADNGTLAVDPRSSGGFDNNGFLTAAGGGTLQLTANGGGSFTNSGGTISANGTNILNQGIVDLIDGVTISGGNITSNATGRCQVRTGESATLISVTSSANVQVNGGATLNLIGTITNNNAIRTVGSTGVSTIDLGAGTVTLNGTGSIVLGQSSTGIIGKLIGTGTLINNSTIAGFGALATGSLTIQNNGTIDANVVGQQLIVTPEATGAGLTNNGVLRASLGTLLLLPAQDTLNNGSIDVQSGGASVGNSLVNAGTVQLVSAAKLDVEQITNNGSIFVSDLSTLSLGNAVSQGTLTNNGTVTLDTGAGTLSGAFLEVNIGASGMTFQGTGTLVMTSSGIARPTIFGSGVLNNAGSHTICGQGDVGSAFLRIINVGTITANVPSKELGILAGDQQDVNTGTIVADSGFIDIQGGPNGSVIDNSQGDIAAINGGTFIVSRLTISGGTLSGSGTETFAWATGGLTGPLLNTAGIIVDNATLPSNLVILDTITNNGTIQISDHGSGGATLFVLTNRVGTLSGTGQLRLGSNGSSASLAGGGTLTNGPAHTIRGFGNAGDGSLTIINQGTFSADQSAKTLIVKTGSVTWSNSGTMSATNGGILELNGTLTSSGTLLASAANINTQLTGGPTITSTGLIRVASTGSINLQSGTLNGNAGSMDVQSGTISVFSAARVTSGGIHLDGTISNFGTFTAAAIQGTGTMLNGSATNAGSMAFTSARVGTVNVQGGAISTISGGGTAGTSRLGSLSAAGTIAIDLLDSKWDLTDHDLVVDYTASSPLTLIASYITKAFHNGAWDSFGLTSSSAQSSPSGTGRTALGYADASTLGITSFSGQTIDSTTALVRYTYSGDANLDGKVNALDFNAVATNFGSATGRIWFQGDFNYDGKANTLDFNALANNFNLALASPPLGTLVPEPFGVSLVLALCFCRRRHG